MRRSLLPAFLLLLSACAAPPSTRVTADHRQLNPRAAVLVVQDVAPRLHAISSEPNLSTRATVSLTAWDARRLLTAPLEKRLAGKGFKVVSLDYQPADLAAIYDSSAAYPNPAKIRDAICALASAQQVDLVMLVYRQMVRDFVGTSNENLVGYGLVKHRDGQVHAYAALAVEAVQARNGAVVGTSPGTASLALPAEQWQAAYDVDRANVELQGAAAAALEAPLRQVLLEAAVSAAQETGLSQ